MSGNTHIWSKRQCIEAYDELMIKIAMSSYAEIDGQKILEENERLKNLPQYRVSPRVENRIRRTVSREMLRDNLRGFGKSFYKITNKVALVFFAIIIAFSATAFASANLRDSLYQLMFTYEQRYTLIELDSRTDLEFVGSEAYTWDHAFAPTVMPKGYAVSDVITTPLSFQVIYENEAGGYISFLQNSSSATSSTIQVDTENAQLVQPVIINDSEALMVSKNGVNTLVWRIGNVMLMLMSDENLETLMAVAKGIKLLK